MPSCFFILLRFFLRVDDVLFRVYDTRIYHRFGTSTVIRECSTRENSYREIRSVSFLDLIMGPMISSNESIVLFYRNKRTHPSSIYDFANYRRESLDPKEMIFLYFWIPTGSHHNYLSRNLVWNQLC